MSAGNFIKALYQDDQSRLWPIYIQPETQSLVVLGQQNSSPAGSSSLPTLEISKGRRGRGLIPRKVAIQLLQDGTGAAVELQQGSRLYVPLLSPGIFAEARPGRSCSYRGIPAVIYARYGEWIK